MTNSFRAVKLAANLVRLCISYRKSCMQRFNNFSKFFWDIVFTNKVIPAQKEKKRIDASSKLITRKQPKAQKDIKIKNNAEKSNSKYILYLIKHSTGKNHRKEVKLKILGREKTDSWHIWNNNKCWKLWRIN